VRATRTAIVGRVAEAAAIERFLDEVPDGPPRGLLIEGEPGIGKSTIWSQAVRAAAERGYRVLEARPSEVEQQLSFAGLGDLLGGVLQGVERALPVPQRDALRAALLLAPSTGSADPRTLATAVAGGLRRLGEAGPLVIAVDDSQWLDRASTQALDFALRRLASGTGVLAAGRAGSSRPALDILATMGRDAVTVVPIGPLPERELRRLVSADAPWLSRPTVARLVAASGGNPFHALELARALRGADVATTDPLPVPASLEELVRERLDRLSDRAREAASAAALSFRPTRGILAATLDPSNDIDAAILEAEEAGVIAWDADRLRFTHPLLGSALSVSLSTSRRRALHRRLAEATSDPEERAAHLVGSVIGPDAFAAAEIELGASAAEHRGAVEAAAGLYLAASERTPAEDGEARARRTLGAADAMATVGDLRAAKQLAEAALGASANPAVRARSLVLLGSIASYIGTMAERIATHEAALAEAAADPGLRAEVLVELGERVTIDPELALEQTREAAGLLRATGGSERLARALSYQVMASAVLGRGAPQDLVDEVAALEALAPYRRINSLIWSHWLDDLEVTRQRFELQAGLARDSGDDLGAAELAEFIAMAEFRAGNWRLAEERLEDACVTLADLDLRGPMAASFADRSVIDAHRGRMDRARGTLRDLLEGDVPLDRFWAAVCLSALGAVEFVRADLAAADRAWTAMREIARSIGWIEFPEDRSEPDHIEALLSLGERDRARELLAQLEWRGRTLPRAWIEATLPRAQALVAAAEGDLDGALATLDGAREIDGLPFERARLLMVKGQLERRANSKLAARRSLEGALEVFERLGSPPWIDRTRAEIERLGLRHRDRHELTAMERRIAELAATGLTNRQVADAAFVSPKTVEANLARVYGKLGIRSRAELGARMGAPEVIDLET
jgi:DNA-binding CsgD family transcriptional regulator